MHVVLGEMRQVSCLWETHPVSEYRAMAKWTEEQGLYSERGEQWVELLDSEPGC